MDGVRAEIDGAVGMDEVMGANAELWGKVPDAGVGVGAVVLHVVRRTTEGRIFMVGPEDTASTLGPEGESPRAGQVPAQDDGGDGGSREGATNGIRGGALLRSTDWVGAEGALEFGCVRLPEGEGLYGVLEAAAEYARADGAGEDFAGVDASHDELEAIAVVSDSVASLDENTELEGQVTSGLVKGSDIVGDDGLRGSDAGGQQEGDDPDCGRADVADALQITGH